MNHDFLDEVLDGLMRRYVERVPAVRLITDTMIEKGLIEEQSDIENDHIAFRTLGVPHHGISSLEKIFLHLGYERRDHYRFDLKKLNAYWYAPPIPRYPRIFISELCVKELSPTAQAIIQKYVQEISHDPVDSLDMDEADQIDQFLHSSLWNMPTLEDYMVLAAESEYASWTIFNKYYLNHYTISVHNLPGGYNRLEVFNDLVEGIGISLNSSGGKIKTSRDGLLRQSSTKAELVLADFAHGEQKWIPGSYVEFAERSVLPEYAHLDPSNIESHHRRDGFETQNADKIFESTYTSQK